MNVLIVAAERDTAERLCRAACAAGFVARIGGPDSIGEAADFLAVDSFQPSEFAALLAPLAAQSPRPFVLAGVKAEADAMDAGLALGVDEFYPAGFERSLVFRLRLQERRGAAAQPDTAVSSRIEQANDVIYTVDFEGRFTSVNAAAERLTGYPRERLVGMNMSELLLPDYLPVARQEIREKLEGRKDSTFFEVLIRHADGQPRSVEISSQLLFEDGKPVAVQGIARDLSDRRRREVEVRFRAELLESLEAAAFATTPEGKILYWNSAASRMFGWDSGVAESGDIVELIVPEGVKETARAWLSGLADGNSRQAETQLQRASGEQFVAQIAMSPLRDPSGVVVAGVVVCLDQTEQRRADARVREMAAIIESAAVAVIARDGQARVTGWNAAAERLLGYTAEEALGHTMARVSPERLRPETQEMADRVNAGEGVDFETIRVTKDGREIPVRVTSSPILDSRGVRTGVATLLYDLTEQREHQRALRASEERYRAAAELSLDAFFILEAVRTDSGEIVDFRVTEMNSATEALITVPREQAFGGMIRTLLPGFANQGHFERYRAVVETGEPMTGEFQVRSPIIRAQWLHQTVVKLGDGLAVTTRDITAQRQEQEALAEARAQLNAIFESTSEAVLVFTPDFRLMTANSAGLEGAKVIFGHSPRPGDDLRPWVHGSDWEHFQANCARALAGERVTVRWPMPTVDGQEIWFEYTFNPVRDANGAIYAVSMAARDISESRAMERAIAEREAQLTAVFESMNESLTLIDPELRYLLGNPLSIARTMRYTGQAPVAGGSMELYVRPEHWRGLRHFHRRALAGEHCAVEIELSDAEGEPQWWEYKYHPVHAENNAIVAVAMVTRDITDRKRAELALQEATHYHRSVVENTTDALFVLDVEGTAERRTFRTAMVNSAFERMTGLPATVVVGRNVEEILPPSEIPKAIGWYERAIAAGGTISYHEQVPFGAAPYIQTTMTPLFDDSGRCYRIIGNSRDITAQVRLQEEERASRARAERLALIVESASDAILSLDLERRIVSWSPGAERAYGYTAEEAIGQPIELIYATDRERALAAAARLDEVFEGGSVVDAPTVRRHKDGRLVDVLISAFPLRDHDGRIVGVGSTASDVSEQRRAEEALRNKAADLNAVFESSRDQVVLLDEAGTVISANHAALRNWAASKAFDRPFGGKMREWVPDEARPDFDTKFATALGGMPVSFERQTSFGGETQWFDVSYNPVRLEDGSIRGVVVTSRNITERKRSTEALMQAQKLESLAVLAGGIAHDFNNLLVGILGNAGLALNELSPASPARPTIEAIETAGQRAAELARQMLAYSGKGRFLIQEVDLTSLVEEMTHLLRVSIGKSVSLQLNLGGGLPAVEADATQLRQVVMNLVVNASDAIGDAEGIIAVSTSKVNVTRELLAEAYLAPDLPAGEYISVEVRDSGSGMDAETLARIFDPFFTTKFTGRGLGLAAVLGIIRSHRGAIKVESQPGEGTTFRLLFPALANAAVAPQPAAPAPWRGEGLVLVVDDEPTVRTVTARALRAFGFEVLEAVDGLDGVERFRERGSEIRAVLLDMTMPRMNGEETFVEIKRMDPGACIILMSGYTEQDATERFSGRGLAGFIQKPYELATLRSAMREALAGER